VLLLCGILAGQHHLERYKEQHEQAHQHSRTARRSTRTRRISNAVVLGEALLFSAMSASIGVRNSGNPRLSAGIPGNSVWLQASSATLRKRNSK